MKEVYLRDLLEEVSIRNKDLGNIPVLSVTNQDGFCSPRDFFAKDVCSKDLSKYKIVKKGEFAYNPSRINVGSIDFLRENLALVSPLYVTFKCKDLIVQNYLKYYLKGEKGNLYIRLKTRGAVRDTLSFKSLAEIKIPLYPLKDQKQIVQILDTADTLRQKRKEQLNLLNDYLKSVFLEMFGDPVENYKKYEDVFVGDVVETVKDGPHVSPKYSDEGVPILSTRNVRPGQLLMDDIKYVSQDTYQELTRRFKPQKGDVLLTKGGTTGYAKTVDFDWPFCVWVHLAVLRPKKCIHPVYLEHALNSDFCYQQSQRYTHGIANRDLGLTRIVKINLLLPPMKSQNTFASIVEQVEQTKQKMRASLDEMDNHFNALMQRYFG